MYRSYPSRWLEGVRWTWQGSLVVFSSAFDSWAFSFVSEGPYCYRLQGGIRLSSVALAGAAGCEVRVGISADCWEIRCGVRSTIEL